MTNVYIGWAATAVVLGFVAVLLGVVIHGGPLGVLIDNRGRYSLTKLQLVLWTLVVVPLVAGVFWGKLFGGHPDQALSFAVPNNLLLVLGISIASTAVSTVTKSYKDSIDAPVRRTDPRATDRGTQPFFAQVFLVEEGEMADRVVDVTKFQNFWFTLILVVGYVALTISTFAGLGDVAKVTSLPDFSAQMVVLLAISHAGYVAGKMPNQTGEPAKTIP